MKSKSDIGNYYDYINSYYLSQKRNMSYLNDSWTDFNNWKTTAKAKALELLSYDPPKTDLSPQTIHSEDCGHFIQEEVSFNISALTRIEATVLVPKNGAKLHPAVVAIHDHGGFYYFGREKILENNIKNPIKSEVLNEFKQTIYAGRSWANELALRGYLVLIIDAFFFGKRRIDFDTVSEDILNSFGNPLKGLKKGSDSYITAFNTLCQGYERLLVKHIFTAGATWPGILAYDDRVSVDYLMTRDDVDPSRIGCCGLSIGGFRSALLAALDSRVKCGVVAGWMPTMKSLLYDHLRNHTYMVYIPGLAKYMELPDLVSLTAPNHLFVQQCSQDALYTPEGMQEACDIIQKVYKKAGVPDNFKYKFYDTPHVFSLDMQEEAFSWFDTCM